MNRDLRKPDMRQENAAEKPDASTGKHADSLVEVRKTDQSQDRENEFVLHQKPFDEQMYESFDDLRRDHRDEDAD